MRFDAEAVRNEKVKILEALKPISGLDVQDKTVRGQYAAGKIGGQEVPAYYFEKNVDNDSDTETFVAVQAEIDNWRWAGVPFYLRTGKRMAKKCSEIVIQFKPVPHRLFEGSQANRLVISLQPEERITLQLMGPSPGKGMQLTPIELDLNLAAPLDGEAAPATEERRERRSRDRYGRDRRQRNGERAAREGQPQDGSEANAPVADPVEATPVHDAAPAEATPTSKCISDCL